MSRLTVYLADLYYEQSSKFHGVPLNIGYLGNALKVSFGGDLDIELFKYPNDLISALRRKKPDILGLSNCIWNQTLSLKMAAIAKGISCDILTVMGGPHIRPDAEGIRHFLDTNRQIDCYIPFVGEFPLIELVRGILHSNCSTRVKDIYAALKSIDGAFLNCPGYLYRQIDPQVWNDIFKFGSPYLNGLLDKFIADPILVPLFETNRGCPYTCTFCSFRIGRSRKIYLNDYNTVLKEFEYAIVHGAGQKHWFITDANFGILSRDIEIANVIKRLNEKYGLPMIVNGATAKGVSYKNVIQITEILSNIFEPDIAIETFDPQVLSNIKRSNLDEATIRNLVSIYAQHGTQTNADMIVALSGETFQSHIATLKKAVELDLNFQVATLVILPGAIIDAPHEREKYGFREKFRFRADSFGVYDNEFIFEIEETVCATNTLSFEEFLDLRCIHLLVYMLWTAKIGKHLLKFGELFNNISAIDIICRIHKNPANKVISRILADLRAELKQQMFDSKEELMKYYGDRSRIELILRDGNKETKLFWKNFSRILLEKENIVALIDEIVVLLSGYDESDPELLRVLRQISIDQLMVDFRHPARMEKSVRYRINMGAYQVLRTQAIIPDSVRYDGGEMTIDYYYDRRKYELYCEIIRKPEYKNNPLAAMNAALNVNFGANVTYNIGWRPEHK